LILNAANGTKVQTEFFIRIMKNDYYRLYSFVNTFKCRHSLKKGAENVTKSSLVEQIKNFAAINAAQASTIS
jgi:hypothetical protein